MASGVTHGLAVLGDMEVDDEGYDSAIGDVAGSTFSRSVTSSVYNFVEENGRTYHSYKEGEYLLPNDETERERLDLQHHLWLMTLRNKLHLSPTGQLHNVLDIGTGTGIWCIEFAQRYPQCHVVGTDLSPIQPDFAPPNCKFEVEDAEDEWMHPQKFDLVHGRMMTMCFKDPMKVINSAVAALKPGGWLEMQDIQMPFKCIDDSLNGTAVENWVNTFISLGNKSGKDFTFPHRYRQMFIDAGLTEIQEHPLVWPLGTWCKGQHLKNLGRWAKQDFLDGIEGLSMALMSRVGGMKKEAIEDFIAGVKAEVQKTSIHAYVPVIVVTGRKPLDAQ